MEEKVRFVLEYERDERNLSELCHAYGIAREPGYVWLRRYHEKGAGRLARPPASDLHFTNIVNTSD